MKTDIWPETQLGWCGNKEYDRGLISVIIAPHNRTDFLAKTMDSARKQTYRPNELLVVHDGSTDEIR